MQMLKLEKEIRSLEYKFEKGINDEVLRYVQHFDQMMEKKYLRDFLLDYFSQERPHYKIYKPLLDLIYKSKTENDTAKWTQVIGKLENEIKQLLEQNHNEEGKEENKADKTQKVKASQELSVSVLKPEIKEVLFTNFEALKRGYKENIKREICTFLDQIIENFNGLFSELYEKNIQHSRFSQQLTDTIKRPFFDRCDYYKTTMFEPKKAPGTSNSPRNQPVRTPEISESMTSVTSGNPSHLLNESALS